MCGQSMCGTTPAVWDKTPWRRTKKRGAAGPSKGQVRGKGRIWTNVPARAMADLVDDVFYFCVFLSFFLSSSCMRAHGASIPLPAPPLLGDRQACELKRAQWWCMKCQGLLLETARASIMKRNWRRSGEWGEARQRIDEAGRSASAASISKPDAPSRGESALGNGRVLR